jgi:glucan-binding YG repeat protein
MMICLLISLIASSLSLVNANDNFITNNDTIENSHRELETDKTLNKDGSPKTANKQSNVTPAPKSSPTNPTDKKADPKVSKDKNHNVIKPNYSVDPLDILKGAGEFRFKTNEDLLKKWQIVNDTNYVITLK